MLAQGSSQTCYQKVRVNLLGLLPLKTFLNFIKFRSVLGTCIWTDRRHFPKAGICYSILALYTNVGQIANWIQTAIWTSLWGVWATSISLLWYCTWKTSAALLWGHKRRKLAAEPSPTHRPLCDWGPASPLLSSTVPSTWIACAHSLIQRIPSKKSKVLFYSLTTSSISILNIKINSCSLEKD